MAGPNRNNIGSRNNQSQVQKENEFDETPEHLKAEKPTQAAVQQIEARDFERSFTKVKQIVSDVFKLTVAQVIKQVGIEKNYDKDPESFKNFEHTHIFRTFDSDGKKHDRCCMTAGHFHDVVWDYDENSKPVIKSISGPKVLARKQVKGKWQSVSIRANDYDNHTHDMDYLQSHVVDARRTNIEAVKVVAFEAQKGTNPGGVTERG